MDIKLQADVAGTFYVYVRVLRALSENFSIGLRYEEPSWGGVVFGEKVRTPFFDRKADPEALYKVDAIVDGAKPLAVALIPGDLDAERAVSAKLALQRTASPKTRWIAIPRDMERLTSRTRKRLVREYIAAGSSFEEDRSIVEERLRDFAA
jgi:hypothetical protein